MPLCQSCCRVFGGFICEGCRLFVCGQCCFYTSNPIFYGLLFCRMCNAHALFSYKKKFLKNATRFQTSSSKEVRFCSPQSEPIPIESRSSSQSSRGETTERIEQTEEISERTNFPKKTPSKEITKKSSSTTQKRKTEEGAEILASLKKGETKTQAWSAFLWRE